MKLNKKEIETLEQLVINEIDFFEKDEPNSENYIFYSNLQDKLNYMEGELDEKIKDE